MKYGMTLTLFIQRCMWVNPSFNAAIQKALLDRPHTTRFLSCDGSDRIRYETTSNRRGSWHLPEIGTLAIHHLTLHYRFLAIVFYLGYDAISQKFLNMFKTLRQAALPSDCYNRDRRNSRGSHTTRCRADVGVVGAIAGRCKLKMV